MSGSVVHEVDDFGHGVGCRLACWEVMVPRVVSMTRLTEMV